eukprot:c13240_g1_i1.p1 GENE.c13240_g1_i1~~c13240_g1_i1.p1  ORF type:complete len:338 (+),score=57.74 c13240_g1_i1:1-1014(+)
MGIPMASDGGSSLLAVRPRIAPMPGQYPPPNQEGAVSTVAVSFGEPSVPAFLLKLYTMLEDPATDEIIGWSHLGATFVVYQPTLFSNSVLPNFFKHSNFQSFIRQLNLYGFHKLKQAPDWHEFAHPLFKRGRKELLKDIKRKIATSTKTKKQSSRKAAEAPKPPSNGTPSNTDTPTPLPPTSTNMYMDLLTRIERLEKQNKHLEQQNLDLWTEIGNLQKLFRVGGIDDKSNLPLFDPTTRRPFAPSMSFQANEARGQMTDPVQGLDPFASNGFQFPFAPEQDFAEPLPNESFEEWNRHRTTLMNAQVEQLRVLEDFERHLGLDQENADLGSFVVPFS